MNSKIYSIVIIAVVILVGWLLSSSIMNSNREAHHNIIERIKHEPYSEDSITVSSVTHLANVDTISVMEEGKQFAILNRTHQIQSFKCTECHNIPLEELKNTKPEMGEKSHWNIKLEHASSDVMDCTTCHSNDDMDVLHTITNKPVSFDESYKVCAQCHQTQFKDWTGGAHGKRVGGWAKPVIRKTCVNCHNPHSPSFPHKLPSRINTHMMQQRAKK